MKYTKKQNEINRKFIKSLRLRTRRPYHKLFTPPIRGIFHAQPVAMPYKSRSNTTQTS